MQEYKDILAVTSNTEHMFSFLKGYAIGLGWNDTLQALYIARDAHKHQKRKSGEPYIVHPETVACQIVSLGIKDDAVTAAALLHDWKEDCGGDLNALPCSDRVKLIVDLVSFDKEAYIAHGITDKQEMLKSHYWEISKDFGATVVKLADRCNNVSTMAGVFTPAKIDEYIKETCDFVLPLARLGKDQWPQYSMAFNQLKYHITAVISGIAATKATYEPQKGE